MKALILKYWIPVLAVLIAGVFMFQRCEINKLKDANQIQTVKLSSLNDSVKTVVSKNGDLTSMISAVEIEKDNLRKGLEAAGFEIKNLKDRDIKWRNINFALQTQLAAAGSGTVTLHDTTFVNKTDTIRAANFDWNNRYLFLSGNIVEKKMDFSYKYKTGIDIIQTRQGKSTLVNVYLSDPNAIVTTGNSIVIVQKNHWYQKPWLWSAAGLVGGYFIGK